MTGFAMACIGVTLSLPCAVVVAIRSSIRDDHSVPRSGASGKQQVSKWTMAAGLYSLAAFFFVIMMLDSLLTDFSDRFLMTAATQTKFSLCAAALPIYMTAIVVCVRRWNDGSATVVQTMRRSAWSAIPLFGLAILLWSVGHSAAECLLFFTARPSVAFRTPILASHHQVHSRSSTVLEAEFAALDGQKLSLRGTDSFFSKRLHHTILVNDSCSVDRLPEGLPVTIYARRSSLGYAVDRVTSDQPCTRP